MRFGYPRSSRLTRGWEYDLVFRTGSRLKGELVRLLFVEASDGKTRYGLAVGKRQGKAHLRVRGRRVLKEAIRRLDPWVVEGVWIVAMLRRKGLDASAVDVYYDMAEIMRRRGMLRADWPGPEWEPRKA